MANVTNVMVPCEVGYDMPDGSSEYGPGSPQRAVNAWAKANNGELAEINRKLDLILKALGVGEI